MNRVFNILLLILLCTPLANAAEESGPTASVQRAILVTGASTGIGRNIAETLAANGYFVYAGARKQKDLNALSAIENIQGIKLDVTIQEEIDAAVVTIKNAGRGLYGLINNAGVAVIGPLIETDEDDLQFQMDVNTFGPYRVTRAFAPLIIESQGRITTTGSISGILSGKFFGAYSMSKHAVEAFTDSLAREMEKFGVQVSVVEPGNYNSAIFDTLLRRMERRGQSAEGSLYQEDLERMLARASNISDDPEPDAVSEAFMHALFDPNPKRRYMVVPVERQARITVMKAMEEMVQLNEGQPYSYDRDALVAMLDELLAASRQ